MKQLDVALFGGPVSWAPGDTVLVLVPEDERPLRGDAGRIDWRLSGELSRLLATGYVSGRAGEAALLPAGRLVQAGRVLLFGVGPCADLPGRNLQQSLRAATAKLLALRSERAVLALPGSIELEVEAEAVLQSFVRGLAADPAASGLRLVIPDASRRARALERAFEQTLPYARNRGIEIAAHRIGQASAPAPRRASLATAPTASDGA